MSAVVYPITRPVADTGVLVEFGNQINDQVHQRVLSFDAGVQNANIDGITECVPSSTCVLVNYDPLTTSYDEICEHIKPLLSNTKNSIVESKHWQIPTCYSEQFAPDLDTAAAKLGLSTHEVIQQHLAGKYKVYMYGFAPGYAYLGGVPDAIQLPRKPAPVMQVPPQTVMIAGPQCLITTLPMPTGWWRIGMTSFKPLDMQRENPFIFSVGDTVEFVQVNEADFISHNALS